MRSRKAFHLFIVFISASIFIFSVLVSGCSKKSSDKKPNLKSSQNASTTQDSSSDAQFLPEISRMEYTDEIIAGNVSEAMVMLDKTDVKIEGDNATVELYIDAEEDNEKNIALDDGQLWSIIVRQGDNVYPLIHKRFVQLGKIDYWVYGSADTKELVVYTAIQENAGFSFNQFVYVSDKEPYFTKSEAPFTNSGNLSFVDKSDVNVRN